MAPFLISCFLLRLSSPREKTMTGGSTQWRMSPINNPGEKHFVKMTEEKKMDILSKHSRARNVQPESRSKFHPVLTRPYQLTKNGVTPFHAEPRQYQNA